MDLNDLQEKDVTERGSSHVPAGIYIVVVDEFEDKLSRNSGKRTGYLTVVVASGDYKGKKIKHYFGLESTFGKSMFKKFLRCISRDNKAPETYTDSMRQHMLGRTFFAGVGLEENGRYVNSRIICMEHAECDAEAFQEQFEKALKKHDELQEKENVQERQSKAVDFAAEQAQDVPF